MIESFICIGAEVAAEAAKCKGGGPLRSSNHRNQQLLAALWLLSQVKGRHRCDTADFGSSILSRILKRNREAFNDVKSIKHICLDLA